MGTCSQHKNHQVLGFTLVELLFSVSITVILLTASVPNLIEMIRRNQANTAVYSLHRIIQMARQEAVMKNQIMTLCVSNDGLTCIKKGSPWIIVFVDQNNNKNRENNELLIYQLELPDAPSFIQTRVSAGRSYLRFDVNGNAIDWGSLIFCPGNDDSTYGRNIIINRVGRPYIGLDTNSDGVRENSDGSPIDCG